MCPDYKRQKYLFRDLCFSCETRVTFETYIKVILQFFTSPCDLIVISHEITSACIKRDWRNVTWRQNDRFNPKFMYDVVTALTFRQIGTSVKKKRWRAAYAIRHAAITIDHSPWLNSLVYLLLCFSSGGGRGGYNKGKCTRLFVLIWC